MMLTQRCAANVRHVQRRGLPLCFLFQGSGHSSAGTRRQRHVASASLSAFTEESRDKLNRELDRLDAVVVLGGGLRISQSAAPLGDIPPWATRRLNGAAQVWSLCQSDKVKIAISGGGSPHGLPVIHPKTGQVVHEGTSYAEYLMRCHGVPPLSILKESSSYDTVGNGYFSSMIHAVPSRWKRIAVVTSEFHMPRSRAIFEKVYGLVNKALLEEGIHLVFASVTDDGVFESPSVLEVRKEKEAAALATWERNMKSITCLEDFHEWFYATHVCYSCARQDEFGIERDGDPRLKDSY